MALDATEGRLAAARARKPGNTLQRFARRRSTIAFVMTLPLIAVIGGLVAWRKAEVAE